MSLVAAFLSCEAIVVAVSAVVARGFPIPTCTNMYSFAGCYFRGLGWATLTFTFWPSAKQHIMAGGLVGINATIRVKRPSVQIEAVWASQKTRRVSSLPSATS